MCHYDCVAKHYGCKPVRHCGLIANRRSQANPDFPCVRNMNCRFVRCTAIIIIIIVGFSGWEKKNGDDDDDNNDDGDDNDNDGVLYPQWYS